nr:MAG TPA: hypothetical protein [Caudoviricetes sp.]
MFNILIKTRYTISALFKNQIPRSLLITALCGRVD